MMGYTVGQQNQAAQNQIAQDQIAQAQAAQAQAAQAQIQCPQEASLVLAALSGVLGATVTAGFGNPILTALSGSGAAWLASMWLP